ncbi:unnamed protein product [Notodromas monacha]|uniref:HMG box domain-containing protein n=1 Tax=Notodromas monacha TaxID=399045 RepID=A0A7R9BTZ9_9CRUS|nr:unnamed protein product [Notodromas monacha]CAG0920100.1 unnamed protein product [Notodromas monacha]
MTEASVSSVWTREEDMKLVKALLVKCGEDSRKPDKVAKDLNWETAKMSKIAGQRFRSLSPAQRSVFENKAKEAKAAFDESVVKFYREHPELRADQCLPKKPSTPFMLFCEAKGVQNKGTASEKTAKFAALSDKKKARYVQKAIVLEHLYADELAVHAAIHGKNNFPSVKSSVTQAELKLRDHVKGVQRKPPSSGYALFFRKMKEDDQMARIPSKERMAKIAAAWKESVSEEERNDYRRKAEALKQEYDGNMMDRFSPMRNKNRKMKEDDQMARIPSKERMAKIAAAWKESVSEEERNDYRRKAEALKQEYDGAGCNGERTLKPPCLDYESITKKGIFVFTTEYHQDYLSSYPDLLEDELRSIIVNDYNQLEDEKRAEYENKATVQTLWKKHRARDKVMLFKNEPTLPPRTISELFMRKSLASRDHFEPQPRKRMKLAHESLKRLSADEKVILEQELADAKSKYVQDYTSFINSLSPDELMEYSSKKKKETGVNSRINAMRDDDLELELEEIDF